MEQLFLGLADGTRLRIVNLLRDGEVGVQDIADILDESQPKISRHLAYLREAGVVETRRDGKRIFYSLRPDPEAAGVMRELGTWMDSVPDLASERRQLSGSSNGKVSATETARPASSELEIFLL